LIWWIQSAHSHSAWPLTIEGLTRSGMILDVHRSWTSDSITIIFKANNEHPFSNSWYRSIIAQYYCITRWTSDIIADCCFCIKSLPFPLIHYQFCFHDWLQFFNHHYIFLLNTIPFPTCLFLVSTHCLFHLLLQMAILAYSRLFHCIIHAM